MLGKKKGQTAMEYLMTYGWAILAVLVIGGVLYYYGVFSPQTLVGESKTGFSQVQVDQWSVSGDSLDMALANRAGEEIEITDIYVTESDGESNHTDVSPAVDLSAGERMESALTADLDSSDSFSSGDAYKLEVAVQFNYTRTDLAKNSSGRISGTA